MKALALPVCKDRPAMQATAAEAVAIEFVERQIREHDAPRNDLSEEAYNELKVLIAQFDKVSGACTTDDLHAISDLVGSSFSALSDTFTALDMSPDTYIIMDGVKYLATIGAEDCVAILRRHPSARAALGVVDIVAVHDGGKYYLIQQSDNVLYGTEACRNFYHLIYDKEPLSASLWHKDCVAALLLAGMSEQGIGNMLYRGVGITICDPRPTFSGYIHIQVNRDVDDAVHPYFIGSVVTK